MYLKALEDNKSQAAFSSQVRGHGSLGFDTGLNKYRSRRLARECGANVARENEPRAESSTGCEAEAGPIPSPFANTRINTV